MERVIEILTRILFVGWPALVVVAVIVFVLIWVFWRRGGRTKA